MCSFGPVPPVHFQQKIDRFRKRTNYFRETGRHISLRSFPSGSQGRQKDEKEYVDTKKQATATAACFCNPFIFSLRRRNSTDNPRRSASRNVPDLPDRSRSLQSFGHSVTVIDTIVETVGVRVSYALFHDGFQIFLGKTVSNQ